MGRNGELSLRVDLMRLAAQQRLPVEFADSLPPCPRTHYGRGGFTGSTRHSRALTNVSQVFRAFDNADNKPATHPLYNRIIRSFYVNKSIFILD